MTPCHPPHFLHIPRSVIPALQDAPAKGGSALAFVGLRDIAMEVGSHPYLKVLICTQTGGRIAHGHQWAKHERDLRGLQDVEGTDTQLHCYPGIQRLKTQITPRRE